MKLECPYCKSQLEEGFIYSSGYSFKWYNEGMGFFKKYTVFGGEILSDSPKVKCNRCKECKKIIIDLNTNSNTD
ncbi:PF20097 family protein [Alkaliphilus peptidifermentans]|uniref:DUF6487 domain-containing protein n=1 Tax=Alkaliphilus peptidifermentans DSM 18978 TaxID=1120976 RepID=A0A1G5GZF9_9FIRM|nr:PF20097 family protein [Alkaliphilus peptidifermentans]SCY56811.1 hypothetical protein SAMN03080606_01844 [Alkaliphilus peptidifermentans DSM 18978]